MSRAKRRAARERLAALGRRLVALVTVLSVLAPSVAQAGLPYSIHWVFTQENPMCEHARLETDGDAFFRVNEMPLSTYEVPGAFEVYADGTERNAAEAEFDSVLLRMGANDFLFQVTNSSGDNACVHGHNLASLVSAPLGLNKPLFDVRRDGSAFIGTTELDLDLSEINPPLARDIANLLARIAEERKALVVNAPKVAGLAEKQSLLQQLDTELTDLVTRPLDEIARTDLDAIFDRYKNVVDPETRAALEQLLDDLKQSVADLQDELARLIDDFGAQADSAADFATQGARDAGWNPDDPADYGLGAGEVPWVEVPDLSDVPGAFSADDNPYAAYADLVIAALEADVSGGVVVDRADFVANVRGWHANTVALEGALRERAGVSLAETRAFLDAQNRVTGYVRRYMDASDWFTDTPVPADLRAYVDTVLKPRFGALADQMKDNLNLWPPDEGLDLEKTQLYQTIDAFAGAMSAIGEQAGAYVDVMGTLVHATSRLAIGFVPYVGPALDLCECITGKAWCVPSGRELSDEERIFSGIGFAMAGGVPRVARGMKNAGVSESATRVTTALGEVDENIIKGFQLRRIRKFKTLGGAVATKSLEPFEKDAAKFLSRDGQALLGVGDNGVREVLWPDLSDSARANLKAPDFLTVSARNKLILSEVKSGSNVNGKVVIKQLSSGMDGVRQRGLVGDVEEARLIMERGGKFEGSQYIEKDGYLFDTQKGKRATLNGFNRFIKVIRI